MFSSYAVRLQEREEELSSLRVEIAQAINRCSAENGSDTPDFILAEYLVSCLAAFDVAVERRASWRPPRPLVEPPEPV